MRQVWGGRRAAVLNGDEQRLSAEPIRSPDERILLERRRYPQRIPNAVGRIGFFAHLHPEPGLDPGEGRGHADAGRVAWLQHQQPLRIQALEGRLHLFFGEAQFFGHPG